MDVTCEGYFVVWLLLKNEALVLLSISLRRLEVVTWLILPVVICLSQRLSHASLRISVYTTKLRMAHYNSYSLCEGNCYTDFCGNSGANTCRNTSSFASGTYQIKTNLCLHRFW